MVNEKIHSRGIGPKVMLTRQPTAGRRKNGGLRIGEMERDSVLSHGVSLFMKESMTERSDKFSWSICKRCGTLAVYSPKNNLNMCNNCNRDDLAIIETPYAFKLLIQEFEAMGIQIRLNTEYVEFPIEQLILDEVDNINYKNKKNIIKKDIENDKDIKKIGGTERTDDGCDNEGKDANGEPDSDMLGTSSDDEELDGGENGTSVGTDEEDGGGTSEGTDKDDDDDEEDEEDEEDGEETDEEEDEENGNSEEDSGGNGDDDDDDDDKTSEEDNREQSCGNNSGNDNILNRNIKDGGNNIKVINIV
jgi:hypothetical protein